MYGEAQRVLKPGGSCLVFSAVEHVPRTALRLPHLAFEVTEKEPRGGDLELIGYMEMYIDMSVYRYIYIYYILYT